MTRQEIAAALRAEAETTVEASMALSRRINALQAELIALGEAHRESGTLYSALMGAALALEALPP